jgi:hypothetical protein
VRGNRDACGADRILNRCSRRASPSYSKEKAPSEDSRWKFQMRQFHMIAEADAA